jgi:hypothetical protein
VDVAYARIKLKENGMYTLKTRFLLFLFGDVMLRLWYRARWEAK